jgi:lipopolysaccharide kinase (Kdo/WaaP) family protein
MSSRLHIQPDFQALFEFAGFDPQKIFTDPRIQVWRKLPDRENCTWDVTKPDGAKIRFHVKRYFPGRGLSGRARREAQAGAQLSAAHIPAARIAAWGELSDGRSFVILEDLAGYQAADKLIQSGTDFCRLLKPTADLAAKLHNASLHHRDLYLCHFFVRPGKDSDDIRLIDLARVRPLPVLTRRRWIVKDLAQFWYSTLRLPITDAQREAWLARYAKKTSIEKLTALRKSITSKSNSIAAHDASLRRREPGRNISISS